MAKTIYKFEYPCGHKIEVLYDTGYCLLGLFFGDNLQIDDSKTCPIHGQDCKKIELRGEVK